MECKEKKNIDDVSIQYFCFNVKINLVASLWGKYYIGLRLMDLLGKSASGRTFLHLVLKEIFSCIFKCGKTFKTSLNENDFHICQCRFKFWNFWIVFSLIRAKTAFQGINLGAWRNRVNFGQILNLESTWALTLTQIALSSYYY